MFARQVPRSRRTRKTGLNIALVADYNIAGQLSLLLRLINRHTAHRARLIVLNDDYLAYDRDLVLAGGDPATMDEAVAVVEQADFFHFARFPNDFGPIRWADRLRPDNCLVQYFGSEIRTHKQALVGWHAQTGILGLSAWDYTMLEGTPFFYHVPLMADLRRMPRCEPAGDVVRIAHAPTDRAFKRTDVFLAAVEEVRRRHPIEVDLIEGVSNVECLERKRRCQITFDQISVGIYGLTAIESMAMGHAVLCGMSNFAMSCAPDTPIVAVDEANLVARLEALVSDRATLARVGARSRRWALQHHDPKRILPRYLWLYDLVAHGHRLLASTPPRAGASLRPGGAGGRSPRGPARG